METEEEEEDLFGEESIEKKFTPEFNDLPLSLLDSSQPNGVAQEVPELSPVGEEVGEEVREESREGSGESSVILYYVEDGAESLLPDARLSDEESEVSFPSLERFGGFSATIAQETKKRPTFSRDLNTFFVQCQTNFTVQFSVETDEVTPDMCIQAMVCYTDPAVLAKYGPILPCSCNAHVSTRRPEYGDRFIVSTARKSIYSERTGHRTVSIQLKDMQVVNGKYTAVYSYASYTSCVAKNARVATVFSLMTGGREVGRDMFFCNVCACPPRDMLKSESRLCPSSTSGPSRRRKRKRTREQSPSHSDSDVAPECDADGYYFFQCRTKSKATFKLLCKIKAYYSELQEEYHDHLLE